MKCRQCNRNSEWPLCKKCARQVIDLYDENTDDSLMEMAVTVCCQYAKGSIPTRALLWIQRQLFRRMNNLEAIE